MTGSKTNVDESSLTHQATAEARNSRTRAPTARLLGCCARLLFQAEQEPEQELAAESDMTLEPEATAISEQGPPQDTQPQPEPQSLSAVADGAGGLDSDRGLPGQAEMPDAQGTPMADGVAAADRAADGSADTGPEESTDGQDLALLDGGVTP